MKLYFRKSFRPLVMRYVLLGVAIFLLVCLVTAAPWGISLLFAAFVVGSYLFLIYLRDFHRRSIVVDNTGVEQRLDGASLKIRWDEAVGVRTGVTDVLTRKGVATVRYAYLYDVWNRQIAFSDLSLIGGSPFSVGGEGSAVVSDVAQPELLLAICAKKTSSEEILRILREGEPSDGGDDDQPRAASVDAAAVGDATGGLARSTGMSKEAKGEEIRSVNTLGLLILAVKLGGNLMKGLGAVFKTVKPGFALASASVYGILFSWKFALALMLMLLVHEYGHVHAMKRSGMKVRGIYFIPFLGAAAVTEDSWRTRAQQAYIALSGPLWGFFLTAVPFIAFFCLEGWRSDDPRNEVASLSAAIASWWALINLFNLLPINPLDGGRLLSSISYSISGKLARVASFAAFVLCLLLAFVFEIYLFVILGFVGLLEFITELEVSKQAFQIEMAGGAREVKAGGLARLRSMTRPVFRQADEARLFGMDLSRFRRLLVMATITPMKGTTAIKWASLYILLVVGLLTVILLLSHRPEAQIAAQILK